MLTVSHWQLAKTASKATATVARTMVTRFKLAYSIISTGRDCL